MNFGLKMQIDRKQKEGEVFPAKSRIPVASKFSDNHTLGNTTESRIDCYYTRDEVLQEIADKVRPLIEPGFTFVDFSCGKNTFAPMLNCKYLAFDVLPAMGAIAQDWLTVTQLPSEVIIGLNPPFGYQGQTAKLFIEHAIQFKPKYLFLILPNMRWKPPNYEEIYSQDLPEDTFYDPLTKKIFKEICTSFKILRHCEETQSNPASSLPKRTEKIDGITVTRKFYPNKYPFIIMRRVGRNTTKQFYCVVGSGKQNCTYFEKGKMMPGITWTRRHNVDTEYFLKIYFPSKKKMEELLQLCQLIYENPETGYERKQPHAVTNLYVWEMINRWQNG